MYGQNSPLQCHLKSFTTLLLKTKCQTHTMFLHNGEIMSKIHPFAARESRRLSSLAPRPLPLSQRKLSSPQSLSGFLWFGEPALRPFLSHSQRSRVNHLSLSLLKTGWKMGHDSMRCLWLRRQSKFYWILGWVCWIRSIPLPNLTHGLPKGPKGFSVSFFFLVAQFFFF